MSAPLHRRHFLGGYAATAALMAGGAETLARGGRGYQIGILETVPAERNRANLSALMTGLGEHGCVQGDNLRIAYRLANGQADRFPALAAELIRLPVDLIVTRGTPATKAAKGLPKSSRRRYSPRLLGWALCTI
jgi:putative ABC transport system substrate-binding protein